MGLLHIYHVPSVVDYDDPNGRNRRCMGSMWSIRKVDNLYNKGLRKVQIQKVVVVVVVVVVLRYNGGQVQPYCYQFVYILSVVS